LPSGCKDLVDVLHRPNFGKEGGIVSFIRHVLFQAHRAGVRELVIGPTKGGGTPIKYKLRDSLVEVSAFPARIHPGVVVHLAHLAQMPEGPFPKEGILGMIFGGTPLKWKIRLTGEGADCLFTRIDE